MKKPVPGLHRISLKIALAVAGAVLLLVLAGRLAGVLLPIEVAVASILLPGGVAYGAAHRLLAARLELARSTLRQIRRHQFDNLDATRTPKGDELNALIWQVYRTGQTLEKELREMKRIENYRREFLGDVSHELKTPIFAVQGFAETLLDGGLEDERFNRSFVEKILRNADRLGNLADDLSEISRLETGDLAMTPEPFNLLRIVEEVIESLEPAAVSQHVTLRYQIPQTLPPVFGDRERIRQVLINLVDNGIKYSNPDGHVEVIARLLPTKEVKVSVVDNGIGIALQHIPRLTERFYRVDKSRSRGQGGTGLGLAIVKHILGVHDRKLMIDSNPGRGSTFGFTLPTATTANATTSSS